MGDVFIENLVKKKWGAEDRLKVAGIAVAFIVVCAALFYVGLFVVQGVFEIAMLLIAAACWGAYKLLQMTMLEYETIVTNGDVDIDKIIARSRRKRVFSVDCKEAEEFARYNGGTDLSKYGKVVWACDAKDSPDLWYLVAKDGQGLRAVVFNAPDRVLGAMRPYLPRNIMITVPKPEGSK